MLSTSFNISDNPKISTLPHGHGMAPIQTRSEIKFNENHIIYPYKMLVTFDLFVKINLRCYTCLEGIIFDLLQGR